MKKIILLIIAIFGFETLGSGDENKPQTLGSGDENKPQKIPNNFYKILYIMFVE